MILKTIRVEFVFVLVVNDGEKAEYKAWNYIKQVAHDMSEYSFDVDISNYVPGQLELYEWDAGCIPYGGDGVTKTKDYQK